MAATVASKLIEIDPYLAPYESDIALRRELFEAKRCELVGTDGNLSDFANGHRYFGIHRTADGWVYREWAPAAEAVFFTGDFNGWDLYACPMTRLANGVFEVTLHGKNALKKGQKVQAIVIHDGQTLRRVPLYATRVV